MTMRLLAFIAFVLLSCSLQAADSSRAEFICAAVSNLTEREQCIDRASALLGSENTASRRESLPLLSMLWPVGWWVLYYGAGLLIGRYIYRDAKLRDWLFLGIRPLWWAVITLFDPAVGVLVYWAAHYSKFAQTYQEATVPPSPIES